MRSAEHISDLSKRRAEAVKAVLVAQFKVDAARLTTAGLGASKPIDSNDTPQGRGAGDGTFTYKTLLVAGVHFMDAYNYDIERVKRCVIHYSAPNGMVYPFCTYNSGPCFREKIEKEFSTPFELKAAKSAASDGNGLVNPA